MKRKEWIILICLIISLVSVGTLTKYNLLYTFIAAIAGGLIGLVISKVIER